MVWCGVVWCGVVWCGVVWCGVCVCVCVCYYCNLDAASARERTGFWLEATLLPEKYALAANEFRLPSVMIKNTISSHANMEEVQYGNTIPLY